LKEKEAQAQELTTELEKTKKETYAQLAAEREANQRQFETITDHATKKLSQSEKSYRFNGAIELSLCREGCPSVQTKRESI
jgi:hypothetical protein